MHRNLIGIATSIMGIYFSLMLFGAGLILENWRDVSIAIVSVILFLNLARWNYLQYKETK